MDCLKCQERLPDMLTDEFANADSDVLDHLRQCADCRLELFELRESFATVAYMSETVDQSDVEFVENVMGRVAELRPSAVSVNVGTANVTSGPSMTWSYGLAAGILMVFLVGQMWYLNRVTKVANATRDPEIEHRIEELERAIADMQKLKTKTESPGIRFVSFNTVKAKSSETETVRVHAIWDTFAGEMHFFGFDMPKLESNQSFALWFRSRSGATRLASEFLADGDGIAAIIVRLPKGEELLPEETIVTVESKPVGESPVGRVWVQGTLR
jgi:hypothetical protein